MSCSWAAHQGEPVSNHLYGIAILLLKIYPILSKVAVELA